MHISGRDVQVSVTMTTMRMNDREGKPNEQYLYLQCKYFVMSVLNIKAENRLPGGSVSYSVSLSNHCKCC